MHPITREHQGHFRQRLNNKVSCRLLGTTCLVGKKSAIIVPDATFRLFLAKFSENDFYLATLNTTANIWTIEIFSRFYEA